MHARVFSRKDPLPYICAGLFSCCLSHSLTAVHVWHTGKRKSPTTLTDEATGEVLWDRAKHTIFANPWARTHFEVAKKGNTVTVLDKNSGALVSECVAQKCTQGDAFLMQSVLLDSVSNVTRLNLSEVLNGDLEIVQVVRAFGESVADRAGGQGNGQLSGVVGDILLVLGHGSQGWNFGKRVMDHQGQSLWHQGDEVGSGWGDEGWFPATFALPVQVLSKQCPARCLMSTLLSLNIFTVGIFEIRNWQLGGESWCAWSRPISTAVCLSSMSWRERFSLLEFQIGLTYDGIESKSSSKTRG